MSVRVRNVENVQELLRLDHSLAEVSLELDDTDSITGGDSAVAKLRQESQQPRVNNKGGANYIFSLLFSLSLSLDNYESLQVKMLWRHR